MLSRLRRALKDAILRCAANQPEIDVIVTDTATAQRLAHPKIIADIWPDVLP